MNFTLFYFYYILLINVSCLLMFFIIIYLLAVLFIHGIVILESMLNLCHQQFSISNRSNGELALFYRIYAYCVAYVSGCFRYFQCSLVVLPSTIFYIMISLNLIYNLHITSAILWENWFSLHSRRFGEKVFFRMSQSSNSISKQYVGLTRNVYMSSNEYFPQHVSDMQF